MIVLDASVLIAMWNAADAHHARAQVVFQGGAALVMSSISLAEALVAPARAGSVVAAQRSLEELGIGIVHLPEDAPFRLALLRVQTGLKMPDCCVLLAAEHRSAALATFDDQLSNAARVRGVVVHA